MKAPKFPKNERQRQKALDDLFILDTPAEERFDRLTRIAKNHFKVPIALVSLVDRERQWFKSKQGLTACETSRDISFCGHAVLGNDIFCIPNALEDPRFHDNPLVTEAPHIRFYAGAPLRVLPGQNVGTLCIIDTAARTLSPEDLHVLRDIADCVQQELMQSMLVETAAKLRARETHLRAVLDTAVDGILSVNAQGIVTTANPSAVGLFGRAEKALIGHPFKAFVPGLPCDKNGMPRPGHYETDSTGGAPGTHNIIGRREGGETFPLELGIARMDQGEGTMFVAIVRDISDRKATERLKVEFISTVSHELRTPLTSIKGALGLIRSGLVGALPEKLGTMLDIAYSNSDRLIRIINDILDIEKIAAGKMPFDNVALPLSSFIEQAIEANKAYAAALGVRFSFEDGAPGTFIHADPDRLMQVMNNLMSNAVKYSPKGERVRITTKPTDDGMVRISISDRGDGIAEKFHDKIFEKFTQADASDNRQKGGTGLGLSISKSIVERLGGTIGYTPRKDRGSTFFFELPMESDEDTQPSPATPAVQDGTRRILICEDDDDVARLIRLMLQGEGFSADIATNAEQAKTLLSQGNYDAMTLDLGLPDQNGVSLIRDLREAPQTRELPIIVISATASAGKYELNGDAIGIIDWMEKPIDPTRLFHGLRRAVGGTTGRVAKILHVEDDPDVARVVEVLVDEMADVTAVGNLAEARRLLSRQDFDLIVLDLMLPDGDGERLLPFLKKSRNSATPIIIFSARDTTKNTVDALYASLVKSRTSNETLRSVIRNAIDTLPRAEKTSQAPA